ncbi:helix-turn-helix transcriptional regulator [Streptomyces sp. XD-27]|uniref:helix-turn-helix domain-containing protein n=1 Tax=Streptomyces sp. XD-27 TaxID=3062779 RepID=UPI0026F479BF|nr:helix-turn-helix transcriptional regulator [Streptomyces sp. XD-27]WKX71616.1 helix-turn-helix transcriptional regulator [Streptomyces sp. XD-27]
MEGSTEGSASMRMFGAVAKALREAQGVTREELAGHVKYSPATVASVEKGRRMPSPKYVEGAEALLNAKGVIKSAAKHLEREQRLPSWFLPYAELEAEVVSLWAYDSLVLYGLVQTKEYARAVLGSRVPILGQEEIDRRVEARLERQALLERVPVAHLSFVIEEWVLRRPLGGRKVMRGQLERLLALGEKRNISIQVMPTAREAHAGFNGAWTLLETPERERLAYVEGQAGGVLIEDRNQVSELIERFSMLRAQALSLGESATLIERMVGEL